MFNQTLFDLYLYTINALINEGHSKYLIALVIKIKIYMQNNNVYNNNNVMYQVFLMYSIIILF